MLCLSIAVSGWAEHIAEVGVRGGVSGLTYRSDYGRMTPGLNAGADLMYTYMSAVGVGVRLGLSYDFSTSRFSASEYEDVFSHECPLGPATYDQVKYSIASFADKHQQMYVSVPVELAFRYNKWLLYVGPKLMLPISMKYDATAKDADLSMHMTLPNQWIGESYSGGGVATLGAIKQDEKQSGDIKSRPIFWAAVRLETGYEIEVDYRNSIVLSVYGEYGVNPATVKKTDNLSVLSIVDNPNFTGDATSSEYIHHRVLTSALNANSQGNQLVSAYNYFSAGVRVAWMFHWGEKRVAKKYSICHCTDLEF